MRRKHFIFATAFLLLFAILALVSFRTPQPAPPAFLDPAKTAAYSNLIAVANQITGNPDSTPPALLPSPIRMRNPRPDAETQRSAFLSNNAATFAAFERAIRDPIEAPHVAYHGSTLPFHDHLAIKVLAKAFIAKGQDAESDGRRKDAADAYMNALRLGLQYEHGPLIYFLVGSAVERMSLRPLQALIPKLSNEDLSNLPREIQSLNRDRISFNEIAHREQYFAALNSSNILDAFKARFSSQIRTTIEKSRKIHLDNQTQLEGVAAASASLLYKRENTTPLTNLHSFIPKYLKSLPLDPFTATPLHLVPVSNGAIIYSLGENKRDEHGRGDDIPFFFEDFSNQKQQ